MKSIIKQKTLTLFVALTLLIFPVLPTLAYYAPGATLNPLCSPGTSGCDIAPTTAVTSGGTGLTSFTAGDLLYASATDTLAKLAIGASGKVLKVSGGNLSWEDDNSGATYTAGNGLTLSGGAFGLNIDGLSVLSSVAQDDYIPIYDTSTGLNTKISRNDFLAPVLGALNYQGSWDASASATPATCDSGSKGHYYVASVAGNGYSLNDWAICNSTTWDKLTSTSAVASVFGRTGIVAASAGDYNASQITNIPAGNIVGTNVQIALNELDTKKLSNVLNTGLLFIGNGSNVATGVALSGDAALSSAGALTINNNAINSDKIADGAITNADISTSTVIDWSKISKTGAKVSDLDVPAYTGNGGKVLAVNSGASGLEWISSLVSPLTSGNIFVGNGSNVATGVTMSGDLTIDNNGVTVIGADKITTAKILDGTITNADLNSGAAIDWSKINTANSNTPTGNISATTIQSAINELDTEKLSNILNSGLIFVGNGSNAATGVAMSGDVTINNSGVTTIGADRVVLGTNTTGNYVAGATANGGLGLTGTEAGTLGVILDGSTLSLSASGLKINTIGSSEITDGSITNADISDTAIIDYSKLGLFGKILDSDISSSTAISWNKISKIGAKLSDLDAPAYSGNAGKVLSTDGTGLVWASSLTNVLPSANIFIGNGSNVATAVAMSGDAAISNTGVFTIASDAINSAKIADGTIVDTDISGTAAISDLKLATISTANKVSGSALQLMTNGGLQNSTGVGLLLNGSTLYLDASGLSVNLGNNNTWTGVQTLLNPVINGGISGTAISTDGTFASSSDTVLASQKAVETLVNNRVNGLAWRQAAALLDSNHTTKPLTTATSIDGQTITNGSRVLFTNLSTGNNRVYVATVVVAVVSWNLATDGQAGDGSPTDGDTLYVTYGNNYGGKTFTYDGTNWVLASSLSGSLVATNNLSDLSDASASRHNLGLGTVDSPTFTGLTLSGLITNGALYVNGGALNSEAQLAVTRGGTGASTLTGLIIGNGTSAMTATTTSAGLAGIISDKTGFGSLVFANSPVLVTPTLGVATATSINGLTPTAAADGFTITGGTTSRILTISGSNVAIDQNLRTIDSPTFAGLTSTGAITAATSTNTINGLIINSGALSSVTGIAMSSGNFSQAGAGSFSTGAGAVNLNGDTTVSAGKTLTITDMTPGSILFAGTNGVVSQKNSNLFWDNTNNRLGIGTTTPTNALTFGAGSTIDSAGALSMTTAADGNLSLTSNGTGSVTLDSGTTGAINIGTGANAKTITIGNTTGATALNLNAGANGINLAGTTILNNSLALKKGSDFSTTGVSTDVDFGNTSLVRLTGNSAQTIDTIAGGTDGKMLTIINAGTAAAIVRDNSAATGTTTNRIYTGTGSNITLGVNATLSLIYDSGASRWRVVGGTGGSNTNNIQTLFSSGSAADWNYTVKTDSTAASVLVTLPTAVGNTGKSIEIIKTDNTANTVRIAPFGTETINGSSNPIYLYTQGDAITVRSDGTNSYIVSDNRSSIGQGKSYMSINATATQSSVAVGTTVAFSSATVASNGSDVAFNSTTSSFTLKAGKTYRLVGGVGYANFSAYNGWANYQWKTTGGTLVGTQGEIINTYSLMVGDSNTDAIAVVTPTVDTTYNLVLTNIGSLSSIGSDRAGARAYIEAVSTQQNMVNTVDSAYGSATSPATIGDMTLTHINGNMALSGGYYTLRAGKTYQLYAAINEHATWYGYSWVDSSNNPIPNSQGGNSASVNAADPDSIIPTFVVYTPTADTQVKLRATTVSTSVTGSGHYWITQLGSTANTGVTLNSLLSAIASGSLDNLNNSQVWNWSTLASSTAQTLSVGSTVFTGSVLGISSTGDSSGVTGNLINLNIIGTSSNAIGMNILNAGNGLSLNVQGAVALKKGTDFSTTGVSNDVNFGNTSLIRLTGSTNQTITGISNGADGKLLTIINAGVNPAIISNQSASSTQANRIITGTASDLVLAIDSSILLTYDSSSSRWRIVGGAGGSSGGDSATTIQSVTAATTLASWGYTVKADSTAASYTVTLPPAVSNTGKLIEVVKTDNSANAISIGASGSETINGSTNKIYLYNQGDSVVIRSDGTNSYIVSDNRSSVGQSMSYLQTALASQTTNLASGDHFKFGSVNSTYGSDITLNTTSGYSTTNGAASIGRFTLKAGKTYRLAAVVGRADFQGQYDGSVTWYNVDTGSAIGQYTELLPVSHTVNSAGGGSNVTYFAPTVDTKVEFRLTGASNGGSTFSSISGLSADIQVVSTPQAVVNTVDYVNAKLSANITPTSGVDIIWNSLTSGNIPLNTTTGVFTLTAGKTYIMRALLDVSSTFSGNWVNYAWVDAATNVQIPGSSMGASVGVEQTSGTPGNSSEAYAIYTPTTNQTVKVRSVTAAGTVSGSTSFVAIAQLGSTASTGVPLSALLSATVTGAIDNLNFDQTWNWSTMATSTAMTLTADALTTGKGLALNSASTVLTTAGANAGSLLDVKNTGALTGFTGNLANIALTNATGAAGNTGILLNIADLGAANKTTLLNLNSAATNSTSSVFVLTTANADTPTNGLVRFNFAGVRTTAGNAFQIDDAATTLATTMKINSNALTTGTGLAISANALTTGSGLSLTSSYAAGNSTNGLLYVANTGAVTNGVIARIASNSTAGSGLTVLANGNVGIGTSTPSSALSIESATAQLTLRNTATTTGKYWRAGVNISNDFIVYNQGSTGVYLVDGSTSWTAGSDRNLKQDITSLDGSILDKILSLDPVTYQLKNNPNGKEQIGFIAQDVLAAGFSDLVTIPADPTRCNEITGENCYGLMYDRFAPYLVKAIQDLNNLTFATSSDMVASTTLTDLISNKALSLEAKVGVVANVAASLQDGLVMLTASSTAMQTDLIDLKEAFAAGKTSNNTSLAIDTLNQLAITGALSVEGHVALGADTVGEATVLANTATTTVTFVEAYTEKPIITVTAQGLHEGMDYGVENVTANGFDIILGPNQPSDVVFSWHAFAKKGDVFVIAPVVAPVSESTSTTPEVSSENSVENTTQDVVETPAAVEPPVTETPSSETPVTEISVVESDPVESTPASTDSAPSSEVAASTPADTTSASE